jgi:hypothetical protein
MSAALELILDLRSIGARIEPAGERLILRAGSEAIPASLVRRVREAKAEILATLLAGANAAIQNDCDCDANEDGRSDRTIESFCVEWLNQHPASSPAGSCALCGKPETSDAVVLPFGTEAGTHAWLHAECWPAWHKARRAWAVQCCR